MTPEQAAAARARRYDTRVKQLYAAKKPALLAHLRGLWRRQGSVLIVGDPAKWSKQEIEQEILWTEFPETDPGRRTKPTSPTT